MLVAAVPASADVVEMDDGRRFEGEILSEGPDSVRIDTRVTPTIRTAITLPRSEIASIERRPLPDGFFDPPPPAPRVSKPDDFAPTDAVYLEVPIHGVFGEQIFGEGVADVLRYARRHRIDHIVFDIDSDGGELTEVEETYDQLARFNRGLTYHAVVRKCLGGALAVALWCDTLHLVPGAIIGGGAAPSASDRAEEDDLLRARVANQVIRQTRMEEPESDIVRAMIDPAQSLAGWNAGGDIHVGPDPPADVSDDDIIFQVGPGRQLQLDYEQGIALGLQPFDGTAADLGPLLGFEPWKLESDFGSTVMPAIVQRREEKAAAKQQEFNDTVEENIQRRRMLEELLEENLKRVAEWDPQKGQYQYYSRRWGWSWRSDRVRLTRESQQKWRERTDLSMGYLRQAAQTVTALDRLDQEAEKLGLERSFSVEDLRFIAQDIQTKYDYLASNRDRRY